MKDELEVKLKLSYWQGAFDTLNTPENARNDKLNKDKITAQTWLDALNWILGPTGDSNKKL
jgi:hypothetical protein